MRIFALLFLAAALLLSSCAGGSKARVDAFYKVDESAEFLAAIKKIRKNEDLYGSKTRFLFDFDQGILYHYAGLLDSSIVHLSRAEEIQDDLYSRSVSLEAAAFLSNDNVRHYVSRPYERLMLHVLLFLNYAGLGKEDEALVESRKAQQLIDKYRKDADDKSDFRDMGLLHYLASILHDAVGDRDDAVISLYKSARAYVESSQKLPSQVENMAWHRFKADDREADIKELQLHSTRSADEVDGLKKGSSEVVFIGYGGKQPYLGEMKAWGTYVMDGLLVIHWEDPSTGQEETIALPAPGLSAGEVEKAGKGRQTRSGTTFHVKFTLPKVVSPPVKTTQFLLEVDGKKKRSETLANLGTWVRQDLESSRGWTIGRTAVRVVLRTIASQKAKSAMNTGNPLLNLLLNVGTDVMADQLEHSDLRIAFLLPRTVQMSRVELDPGRHRIQVKALDSRGRTLGSRDFGEVRLKRGEKKFLFYPSLY